MNSTNNAIFVAEVYPRPEYCCIVSRQGHRWTVHPVRNEANIEGKIIDCAQKMPPPNYSSYPQRQQRLTTAIHQAPATLPRPTQQTQHLAPVGCAMAHLTGMGHRYYNNSRGNMAPM